VCALVGLAVTVWVIGMRGVLQDRAVLDRWVAEVMAATKAVVDQLVATRVLAAEAALTSALADDEESARQHLTDRVAEIDARLRQQALSRTQAAAVRDREMPAILSALKLVRAELGARKVCTEAQITAELTGEKPREFS
jgi:hypothetical protein